MPSPLSEGLSVIPENNTRQAPENNQAHIRHDRGDIAALDDPWSDELRETVAPDVLVDCDGDKDRACDRLVGIDRVCRRY